MADDATDDVADAVTDDAADDVADDAVDDGADDAPENTPEESFGVPPNRLPVNTPAGAPDRVVSSAAKENADV